MKTKLFFVAIVIALIIIYGFYSRYYKDKYDVLLLNVEALANGENGVSCFGSGSVDCPVGSRKVFYLEYQ